MFLLNYVGALTSKVYSFRARPWELKNFMSIDFFDSLCSNILVSTRGAKILRILPRLNYNINNYWISDKIRFCYDAIRNQRLLFPMYKEKFLGLKFINVSWETIFMLLLNIFQLNNKRNFIEVFLGNFLELESLVYIKDIFNRVGSSYFYNYLNLKVQNVSSFLDFRNKYLFNSKLVNFSKLDLLVFLGINPRIEIPVLNIKIKKLVNLKKVYIFSFGYIYNLTYSLKNLGNNFNTCLSFLEGKIENSKVLSSCKFSFFLLGINLLLKDKIFFFLDNLKNYFLTFLKISTGILFFYINDIILLDLNLLALKFLHKKRFNLLYIFDNDEININKENYNFIVYQGHHGDINALNSDIILPGVTLFEKIGTFINIEGLVQQTSFVINPTKYIRNDVKILKNIVFLLNLNLKVIKSLCNRILELLPFLKFFFFTSSLKYPNSYFYYNSFYKLYLNNFFGIGYSKSKVFNYPITSFLINFYLNNNLSRFSVVMALCSNRFVIRKFVNFINT